MGKEIIRDENGRFINIETGEIILKKEEIKQIIENEFLDKYSDMNSELRELDLDSELVVVKYKGEDYKCTHIKLNYTFQKVFRVDLKYLIENNKISKNAGYFIFIAMPYLYFPTNSFIYHGKTPTMKELEEIFNLDKNTLYKTLKELEKLDIIKRVKKEGRTVLYFNPFLFSTGKVVLKDTYELFKNSLYNPNKKY